MERIGDLLRRAVPGESGDLEGLFRRRGCARGESVLRQGEVWDRVFLVERGLLRLFFLRLDGREFNKNFLQEGELACPLTPSMWEAPSLFGIRCVEPTTLWSADAATFRERLGGRGLWEGFQREALVRLVDHKLQREARSAGLRRCGALRGPSVPVPRAGGAGAPVPSGHVSGTHRRVPVPHPAADPGGGLNIR